MSETGFPDLKTLVDIKNLIDQVALIEDKLADAEKGLYHELRDKYASEVAIGFEDKVLLEVMLRNVTIRKDMDIPI
ncbi:MAG: hypothetical protein HN644_07880 [Rhodospirillales bacterium]|nr:hypothetical protein [Rhodospirillales bacterium]MBT4040266.1 hypothetical protein [Rhodospirillales bacterium]MBT4626529.1 hypothetical protein [Rhodospirillales bacterium]MBT5352820.1 hypothetical protein [Rhodospirillales bacterium]MBT5520140.1 hypothetical protein [Rhodospirillales bacterium]